MFWRTLSREEVHAVLAAVRTPHNHAFLSTVYACGLRLQEAQCLEIGDIDSGRMMIHVHRGKGAKDRFVPLPESLLKLLRRHWATHRHPCFLFPALGRGRTSAASAIEPMPKSSARSPDAHCAIRGAGGHDAGIHVRSLALPGRASQAWRTAPDRKGPIRATAHACT